MSGTIREVIERPYRLIYRIREEQVDVLTVVHGRGSSSRQGLRTCSPLKAAWSRKEGIDYDLLQLTGLLN